MLEPQKPIFRSILRAETPNFKLRAVGDTSLGCSFCLTADPPGSPYPTPGSRERIPEKALALQAQPQNPLHPTLSTL